MQKPGLFGMNGVVLFLLVFCPLAMKAQQTGSLILIDAENKQSFTLRVGDQLYTSSSHGHLVLSHLTDSSYRLNIRFPKRNLEEQVFPVTVHSRDMGFQLRGADSSWILYDWQTKQTIRPVHEPDSTRILEMGIKREDGFSKLMAAVVNDTAVMYNTYKGNLFEKDSSVVGQQLHNRVTDSLLALNNQPPSVILQPSSNSGPPSTINHQSSTIKKLREVNLKISRKMVFLDRRQDGQTDTVTLFVYFETDTILKKQAGALATQKTEIIDSVVASMGQTKNKSQKTAGAACGQPATDEDMEFLRAAVLKANTDQEKIAMATSAFALKCFTVSQIRLLAGLFVSDKSKYRLMDAARHHVVDHDHFRELADMYIDKNFQRKFLIMAEKRS